MQQAYLFDYIQPGMPAFNTNLFKLVSPDYFCSHVYQSHVQPIPRLLNHMSYRTRFDHISIDCLLEIRKRISL